MNTYFNLPFSSVYNLLRLIRLNFIFKLRSQLSFFTIKNLYVLIVNYFIYFKNLFKINFKLKLKHKKKLKYNFQSNLTLYAVYRRRIDAFFKFSNFFKNSFLMFSINNSRNLSIILNTYIIETLFLFKSISVYFLRIYKKTLGEGLIYIRGFIIIIAVDACITDDEPLWEPIEWSLLQTWIFFIFAFAWIGENLISSRFGNYTGRDKRVWLAWYKSFWLIEMFYAISYGAASLFVIVPFYYELTYSLSFVFSWWNWYNKIFFFKFLSVYTLILLISYYFLLNIKWLNWKKLFFFVLIINFFIAYLLYTHFIMAFFAYFTDPLWYQKTRFVDYIQLSHEPLKWGWGPAKRDHFTYHKTTTVFWFKNDAPFAGAFLMFHLFFFLSVFFLYIYWLLLLRRIYTTKEVTYPFSTYCVSSLKQFFLFFLLLFILVFISFIVCYWRFPIEFIWLINTNSWVFHFFIILKDYFSFLLSFF